MASLFKELVPQNEYVDRESYKTMEDQNMAKSKSTTAYVGNLSFFTTELQLYNFFSFSGNVEKIVMGLNGKTKTPCGFCFIIFYDRESLLNSVRVMNGITLDGKQLKVEIDPGFKEGRQFGRGSLGGQKSDERRAHYKHIPDLLRGDQVERTKMELD